MTRCTHCGNENRAGARFCDSCGYPLTGAEGASQEEPDRPSQPSGEAVTGPIAASSDAIEPETPASIGGRYVIGEYLGRGGRKDVFRARDRETGQDVALALFDIEGMGEVSRARARREVRAMERLGGGHPHVVAVLDTGELDGRPFVVSSYIPGGDVGQLLEEATGGRLPVRRALEIAIDVCRALEFSHERGIVHRDLKPANVWLGDDGAAYLGDFGLATTGRPRSGALVGTVAYLPPEQALGRPAGPAADLYSLGAMLYEMLAGRPPFTGDDAVAIIGQHLNADPIPPSRHSAEVSEELDRIVLDLLAKDPSARPASAATLRERLVEVLEAPPPEPEPTPPPERNPLEGLAGGVFVGRESEVASLREVAERAIEGSGQLVLIGGEPGIGKTRLAEELATYAMLRDASAHWGYCQEGDGAPAYWPWAQAIRSYVREADPVALAAEMGSGVDEIARIVPEAAERVGTSLPDAAIEDERDRYRLFDAVARFLANAAETRPLVIALDDLHWADEPSLLLLRFLVAEVSRSRLLLIGTFRDVEVGRHHPLRRLLGELSDETHATRLVLRGLKPEDVDRYVEMTVGPGISPEFSRAVYEQTEGNPFFMAEVVRLLASEGSIGGGTVVRGAIPAGVRDVIGRRLDRLSSDANEALRIGAVIGRDFDRDVLLEVVEDGEDRVDSALAEAEAAKLVRQPTLGRFRFWHPLVRETLYEEIGPSRRPAMHAKIAAALEHLYSADPARVERRLAQLAHHYSLALAAGDPEKAVEYSERAGRQAISRLGYEEGAEHLGRALEALDLVDSDPDRRCSLMLELGVAQLKAGHPREGRATLEEAAGLAEELDDADRLARAALGAARTIEPGLPDPELTELLELALSRLEEDDSAVRARLTSALAEQSFWDNPADPDGRSARLNREAVAMARRVGVDAALARALSRSASVDVGPGSAERGIETNSEVIEISRRAGDLEFEMRAHMARMRDYLALGEIVNADRDLQAYARLATELRQPRHHWTVAVLRSMRAALDGRLDEAESLAIEARDEGLRAEEPLARQIFVSQASLIYRWQRRLGEVAAAVRELAAGANQVPVWAVAETLLELELGDVEAARGKYERLAADGFSAIRRDRQWLLAHALLGELAFRLGDPEGGEVLHERLAPFSGEAVIEGRAAVCWGPVDRAAGLASAAAGRLDRAVSELESAVAFARAMGDRSFVAETELNLAEVLTRRGAAGDRPGAMELVDDTLGSAQEMEMRTVTDRALALKLEVQGLAGIPLTTSIDEMVSAMRVEGPDMSGYAAPDGTVTILFSDIEDSSVLIERLGDERWIELLRSHNRVFRRLLSAYGGYEVKNQGDGFMLAFTDPLQAVRCSVAVQREMAAQQREGKDPERIRVRMGLHTGETIAVGGDFYGRNVVVAARIASHARGSEILMSSAMRKLVESRSDLEIGPEREVELKGLSGTYGVSPVIWN